MVMIDTDHAEWAVVDRLCRMLTEPSHRTFNVTQSYSLCLSILAWVMQRVRTPNGNANTVEAVAAVGLVKALKNQKIEDFPWALETRSEDGNAAAGDFRNYCAFEFLVWLRNAMCHGDARKILPVNQNNVLIGFEMRMTEKKVFLREADLRRIGQALANLYCNAIKNSRDDEHFEKDASTLREKTKAT